MKNKFLISLFCFAFVFVQHFAFAQQQGVKGRITIASGNQMPGPDKKNEPTGAAKRKLLIYEALKIPPDQTENGFFSKPNQKPVKVIRTNKKGYFKTKLPTGKYSLLIAEGNQVWGNTFDGDLIINPFSVTPALFTEFNLEINHSAYY